MTIFNGFTHDIPYGGTAGQVLAKLSNKDYDTKWADVTQSGGNIPTGGIIIWSGASDAVPDGWAFCDGTNNTPDLRDRFVLSAGTNHTIGETGGAEEVTLTVAQMPEHTHKALYGNKGFSTGSITGINRNEQSIFETGATGGSQPHPNMPPYYVLAYIMKL